MIRKNITKILTFAALAVLSNAQMTANLVRSSAIKNRPPLKDRLHEVDHQLEANDDVSYKHDVLMTIANDYCHVVELMVGADA